MKRVVSRHCAFGAHHRLLVIELSLNRRHDHTDPEFQTTLPSPF